MANLASSIGARATRRSSASGVRSQRLSATNSLAMSTQSSTSLRTPRSTRLSEPLNVVETASSPGAERSYGPVPRVDRTVDSATNPDSSELGFTRNVTSERVPTSGGEFDAQPSYVGEEPTPDEMQSWGVNDAPIPGSSEPPTNRRSSYTSDRSTASDRGVQDNSAGQRSTQPNGTQPTGRAATQNVASRSAAKSSSQSDTSKQRSGRSTGTNAAGRFGRSSQKGRSKKSGLGSLFSSLTPHGRIVALIRKNPYIAVAVGALGLLGGPGTIILALAILAPVAMCYSQEGVLASILGVICDVLMSDLPTL